MPTVNQLLRKGRKKTLVRNKVPAMKNCPQKSNLLEPQLSKVWSLYHRYGYAKPWK